MYKEEVKPWSIYKPEVKLWWIYTPLPPKNEINIGLGLEGGGGSYKEGTQCRRKQRTYNNGEEEAYKENRRLNNAKKEHNIEKGEK